jgi:predicted dehydrogenase
MSRLSRRRFLHVSAVAAAGPAVLASPLHAARAAANDRIQLGFIGVGTMGRGHVHRFLGYGDVQVVAVCDVVDERAQHCRKVVEDHYAQAADRAEFKGCDVYGDFRELVARDDIDAVVIATPDHWHALPCVTAARAKKDIYCEKPLTHSIAQGRKIIQAVRENSVVFQTGSQQRSEFEGKFRVAAELVRNGRIGRVRSVRIGVGGPPHPCDLPTQDVPPGTDWDTWLGPAPYRGYHEELCPKGVHQHFPAWRNYREYAGGGLADMGAHHFDIAQWALDMDGSGPVLIEPPRSDAETGLKFTYANAVEMFHGGKSGCTFEGTDGTIYVDRGTLESDPAEIVQTPLSDSDTRLYHATDHARNWLDCIRSREEPICPAEVGTSSATVCHLANLGYELRRELHWDPEKEQFLHDDEANSLRERPYREPWGV